MPIVAYFPETVTAAENEVQSAPVTVRLRYIILGALHMARLGLIVTKGGTQVAESSYQMKFAPLCVPFACTAPKLTFYCLLSYDTKLILLRRFRDVNGNTGKSLW